MYTVSGNTSSNKPSTVTPDNLKYVRLHVKDTKDYIVVDTTLHTGSEAERQLPKFAYADPATSTVGDPINGNNLGRHSKAFNFKFAYEPTNDRVLIKVQEYPTRVNGWNNTPVLVENGGEDGNDAYTYWPTTTTYKVKKSDGTYESGDADVTNFFWTVKEEKSEGTTYFTFTNAKTGKYLTFSGSSLVTNADNASAAGGVIYFDMAEAANGLLKTKDGQYVKFADGKLTLVDEANKAEATTFAAYTVAEKELEADELNAVMGGDGFSLSPVGTTVADENNVFSQQIKAIKFGHAENEVSKEVILPGLYFVVDAPEELTKLLNS